MGLGSMQSKEDFVESLTGFLNESVHAPMETHVNGECQECPWPRNVHDSEVVAKDIAEEFWSPVGSEMEYRSLGDDSLPEVLFETFQEALDYGGLPVESRVKQTRWELVFYKNVEEDSAKY